MNYILSIFLSVSSIAFGEHIHMIKDGIIVDVTVEPLTFTVGDAISLRIDAIAQEDVQLSLPHDNAFGSFVVTDETSLLDVPVKGGRLWVWSLQLDTFDASTTSLSDIKLDWTNTKGQSGSISIQPIAVHITSVAGDTLQDMELRELKGTLPLLTRTGWWPLLILACILVGGIFFVSRFFFDSQKPTLSPHEKAMLALHSLSGSNQDVHSFYTSLSNIVRTYIEDRFQISAHGQTTREFLIAEKENPRLEQYDRQALADFLIAADLVKFARFEPESNTWDEAIQRAKQFISNTIGSTEPQHREVIA
jgi:hypothetical protein